MSKINNVVEESLMTILAIADRWGGGRGTRASSKPIRPWFDPEEFSEPSLFLFRCFYWDRISKIDMAWDGVGRKFGNLPAIHCALRKRTNRNKALPDIYIKKVDNELYLLLDKG